MARLFWIVVGLVVFYNIFLKEDQKPNITYQQITSPSYSPSKFGNYNCTVDCSGHEAGYKWAEDNMIDDEDDCGGNSLSFIEGCRQYVEDNN